MVIPRAMVRDLAEGHAAAVLLSRLSLVMGGTDPGTDRRQRGPRVRRLARHILDPHRVWRPMLGAGGCFCCQTPCLEERRIRLRPGEQSGRYRSILAERGFLTTCNNGRVRHVRVLCLSGRFSPVFIQGFGLTPAALCDDLRRQFIRPDLLRAAQSRICCGGSGLPSALRGVSRVHLAATASLTVIAFAGLHILPLVIAPVFVAISCMGMPNPNTIVGALARHQHHAGSASSVMGTGQDPLGAFSGLMVGLVTDGTPRGMAALMLLGSIGMMLAMPSARET